MALGDNFFFFNFYIVFKETYLFYFNYWNFNLNFLNYFQFYHNLYSLIIIFDLFPANY